jgi:uncharacterized protein
MSGREALPVPFGRRTPAWGEASAKSVTFIVTEDCQLRCRYCYLHGKNHRNRMEFDVGRRTIDYLLAHRDLFPEKSIVWEFIGGEPFLEIDLIDELSDYAKKRMYETGHPWFDSYRFSFSTNGILYGDPKVQRYLEKNRTHASVGLTIDGTKRKHDLQRVYPDGSGSYDEVAANVPLWLAQFPEADTKVTVAHDDLPFVRESVAHLWGLGIKNVNINVVFEEVWREGDDLALEGQLKELADLVLAERLYRSHNVSFFSDMIGRPLDRTKDNRNWCGAGRMLAVDYRGAFYPCIRFAPFSMARREAREVGDCVAGIDENRLRPFLALDRLSQSSGECADCEVASGCAWCPGFDYDAADSDTIYQRATFICKMHKARVRANEYFWDRYYRALG